MKVLVSGARSITDKDALYAHLDMLLGAQDGFQGMDVILSGGQKGVDSLVQQYAQENDIAFVLFKPYHLLDAKAEFQSRYFFVRNKQMVDNADWVIVFPDGKDTSTEDIINYAEKRHKSVTTIGPEEFGRVGHVG